MKIPKTRDELWLASRLSIRRTFALGVTTVEQRARAIGSAIRARGLEDSAAVRSGETYSQIFARLYGEPLEQVLA